MSEATPANPIDENEVITLLYSLEELIRKTKELHDSMPDTPVKENLRLHLACILSAAEKIRTYRKLDGDFHKDEFRVMYIAVCELRDKMNSVLDSRSSSEETRQQAFTHLKVSNALLRKLKGEMLRNGYELDPTLSAAYS